MISSITSNNTTAATQQAQSAAAASGNSTDSSDMFMTLLMTELKAQDPTSPMDPTQMVGQMVQFNTLSEIMKIRQLVQAQTPVTTATGGK